MCVSPPMAGSGEIIADAQNEKVRTFSGCVVCARWPVIWIDQSYTPMRMMASARGGCEAAARAGPLKLGGYKKGQPVSSRPNSPRTRPTTHHRLPITPELPFELSSHPRYSVSGFGLSRRPFPSLASAPDHHARPQVVETSTVIPMSTCPSPVDRGLSLRGETSSAKVMAVRDCACYCTFPSVAPSQQRRTYSAQENAPLRFLAGICTPLIIGSSNPLLRACC